MTMEEEAKPICGWKAKKKKNHARERDHMRTTVHATEILDFHNGSDSDELYYPEMHWIKSIEYFRLHNGNKICHHCTV